MSWRVRRLGTGDETVLETLARDDAEYDVPGRGRDRPPLPGNEAVAYLADPGVLHWVAEEGRIVVGHVLCYLQRRRVGEPRQLMLYEIGVREGWRRRGVGRDLLSAVDRWMSDEGVARIWLLADNPEAIAFYEACGFTRQPDQPVLMSRRRSSGTSRPG